MADNFVLIGIIAAALLGLGVFLTCGLRIRSRLNKKNRSGAHVSLGDGSTKKMKKRIVEKLDQVNEIKSEPFIDPSDPDDPDIWRKRAVDETTKFNCLCYRVMQPWYRPPSLSMDKHVDSLKTNRMTPPNQLSAWQKLARFYNRARYGHQVFSHSHYNDMMKTLRGLESIVERRGYASHPTSPSEVTLSQRYRHFSEISV
ncbi:uncharacterized protein [Oscarella lobularis]|uniref:uncharacterized protein isoform X2 n=1 Tax=Oscarella lobularis TaxID=121494 RepID=UPI003313DA36